MAYYDFGDWRDGHSEYILKNKKLNPNGRPYLCDIYVILFTRGSFTLKYKNDFDETEFTELHFLKKVFQISGIQPRGVLDSKAQGIINVLCPLMPSNRRKFWMNLDTNPDSVDLIDQDEDDKAQD